MEFLLLAALLASGLVLLLAGHRAPAVGALPAPHRVVGIIEGSETVAAHAHSAPSVFASRLHGSGFQKGLAERS